MNTVLLIEPKKTVERQIRDELEGFRLISAASARNVVSKARRYTPDVIVMDVGMPGDEGFKICQLLRVSRNTSDTPILFFSEGGASLPGLETESDSFVSLIEPSDVHALAQRVVEVLSEGYVHRAVREALPSGVDPVGRAGEAELSVDVSDALAPDEQEVLAQAGLTTEPAVDLRPVARRITQYRDLLASSLTTSEAANRLGVTPGRIRQLLLEQPPRLFGIRQTHSWRLPAFQFVDEGLIPNFEKVLAHLDPGLDPIAVAGWFERPNLDLEGEEGNVSPRHWLSQGKDWRPVAELAENL